MAECGGASTSKGAFIVGVIVLVTCINLLVVLPKHALVEKLVSSGKSKPEGNSSKNTREHVAMVTSTFVTGSEESEPNVSMVTQSPLDFMTRQQLIQRERRQQLRGTCSRYDLNGTFDDLAHTTLSRLIVDEKYRLIYCSVPKIASTSWKRVLLVLRGVMDDPYDLSQPEVNNEVAPRKLKYFQFFGKADQKRMLRDYTKFLVVRDQFSRVLSAYRNKLDPASTFPRAPKWQQGTGMKILNKYKPKGAERRPVFKKLRTRKGIVSYDLNFSDFVKYLVDPNAESYNGHWAEINVMCSPCLVDYDIISKMESLDEDAKYILRTIHADAVVEFPSSDGSSPTNSSNTSTKDAYFREVPRGDLQKLYTRFKLDFELFGYGKPDVLSKS